VPREFLDVDPRVLRASPQRLSGADPFKLARDIAIFGPSMKGMIPLEVTRCKNGLLQINDGMTRATRIAKLLPGALIRVEVIDTVPTKDVSAVPTIEELIP
jgi:hypothetical protein